jgi:carboxyl-terminal processing protease
MRLLSVWLIVVMSLAGCAEDTQEAGSTTSSTLPYGSGHIDSFDLAWATIDERFYDPDFGGLDWEGIRDRYRPLALEAKDHDGFLVVINTMLFELGVSHVGVVPADDLEQVDPILTAPGGAGFDVRLVGDDCLITAVEPGSPSDAAGLRAGYILDSVAGVDTSRIIADAPPQPPLHERGRRSTRTNQIRQRLYGKPGAQLTVSYRDADDEPHETTLSLAERGSPSQIMPGLPPAYTEWTVTRLEGGIAYLRFNAFLAALLDPVTSAIDQMSDAPGLIIDLRGNPGGVFQVRKALVDHLVNQPDLIWTYNTREGSEQVFAEPTESPYTGALVVLVDVLSASSAEEFSGALQAMGRATIVGERTAGRVLVQRDVELPNGDLMIYPSAQTVVSDGTILESHGVIPDIPVLQNRADLLEGVDTALEAALDHLETED